MVIEEDLLRASESGGEHGLILNISQSEDWSLTVNALSGHTSFFGAHEGHGLVRTPHLEDGGDGGAAEDRARLCELFDGLWKPGGQG
ncbi:hypothetical protein PPACK8108_LOCUS9899 [Phakopsora pachyrhizi]|uniref:Uncharacterized protein n=1 Tax=Phakopsora pachyrhizi TaxID=170000 RepID=A0AAV0AXC3_PHAPC|nr:hypothetical protein PPACK8108_LOCUS9899 [Phakopsora pachyrhizi]